MSVSDSAIPVKVSRRGGAAATRVRRGGVAGGRRGGMVASQSVAQEPQNNDMYCSPYGEYYPDSQYYVHGGPPEMCPAHTGMCTVHGDYGKTIIRNTFRQYLLSSIVLVFAYLPHAPRVIYSDYRSQN